jgi:type II secretory pathway predicted ATPase ExeA
LKARASDGIVRLSYHSFLPSRLAKNALPQAVDFMQILSPPAVGDNSKNVFFFDNRARAALRRGIMAAIIDDTPFIVLTGHSGSGKTTLISQFVPTLPNGIEGIMISQTSHSGRRFDDVLLHICRHIALEPVWNDHPDAEQIQRIQKGIRHYLTQNGTRLLLILDQGEETFLAMLERVRKMVDAVNDGAAIMHLLLIGRENLLADLKRLRLAHLREIPERYFTLPLLDDSDLPDFLRQWLAQARSDIQGNTISLRGWQTLCAEAGGKPGNLAALLDERIDTLTLTGDQPERHPDTPDKTGKTKPLAARQKQKRFTDFSLTTLAGRLEDALLTPPPGLRSQRPTIDKGCRAARHGMSRRLVNPTRLRRKNIIFWGKLYRQSQLLRKRIAPMMTAIFHAGKSAMDKLRRGIARQRARALVLFSTAANQPWAKNRRLPAHRPASLRGTIATACATAFTALPRGRQRLLSTVSQARSCGVTKFPALPPGVLKKFVVLLVAVWLVAIGVAALWQGFSHVSLPGKNKQEETQTLTEKASQPPANPGEEDILPGAKPAGQAETQAGTQMQPGEQEIISGPAAGTATATTATAIAPKAAVKAESRSTAAATRAEKEPVKITVGKKKKKVALETNQPIRVLEAKKPIRILPTQTVKKVKL